MVSELNIETDCVGWYPLYSPEVQLRTVVTLAPVQDSVSQLEFREVFGTVVSIVIVGVLCRVRAMPSGVSIAPKHSIPGLLEEA